MDDCSPVRGEMAQDGGTGGETFHGKMYLSVEKARAGLRHALVCLNVTGRTKGKIVQSKRARAGSLAIVDWSQVARTCILRAFGLQISCRLSLVLRLFCFTSFCVYAFTEAAALRPTVLRSSICMRPDNHSCFFLFSFFWRCRFFRVFLYHYRVLFV